MVYFLVVEKADGSDFIGCGSDSLELMNVFIKRHPSADVKSIMLYEAKLLRSWDKNTLLEAYPSLGKVM